MRWSWKHFCNVIDIHIDGLMKERRNSNANAMEVHLFALTHRYGGFVRVRVCVCASIWDGMCAIL